MDAWTIVGMVLMAIVSLFYVFPRVLHSVALAEYRRGITLEDPGEFIYTTIWKAFRAYLESQWKLYREHRERAWFLYEFAGTLWQFRSQIQRLKTTGFHSHQQIEVLADLLDRSRPILSYALDSLKLDDDHCNFQFRAVHELIELHDDLISMTKRPGHSEFYMVSPPERMKAILMDRNPNYLPGYHSGVLTTYLIAHQLSLEEALKDQLYAETFRYWIDEVLAEILGDLEAQMRFRERPRKDPLEWAEGWLTQLQSSLLSFGRSKGWSWSFA